MRIKPIKHEERYLITDSGIVWSTVSNIELKPSILNGYKRVSIGSKVFKIHRLVASHFIEKNDGKDCVNHIDGNKLNNHYSNLEWCTPGENMHHAKINGLTAIGERCGRSIFTRKQVEEIRSKYKSHKYSTYKLAKEYGASQTGIYRIVSGKHWAKT